MQLWNQFLTVLKRKLGFRGVRVLELHEEHGCHFHVITNERFPIRKILSVCERRGFGRIDVRRVTDAAQAISYLCKYLSKHRERCLKRSRLWSAFGNIERTRVKDVLVDTPRVRLLRRIMGKRSIEDELNGIQPAKSYRGELNFQRALQKAEIMYLLSFDPEHLERQEIWQKIRFAGLVDCLIRGRQGMRRRTKVEGDMLASRSAATVEERFGLLNCRRLPARLNTSEAALLLGFQEHDVAPLVAAKLLLRLGKPGRNSPKHFAAVTILERAGDVRWLCTATKVLAKHWRLKNERRGQTGENGRGP